MQGGHELSRGIEWQFIAAGDDPASENNYALQGGLRFRAKLDALGFGFVIPVFFVASGIRLDVAGLVSDPGALARTPLFLLALLVVRGLPAVHFRGRLTSRQTVASGLLQATSLPFLVTASMIGVDLGVMTPVNGAALVAAGVASVLVFPAVALALLRTRQIAPGHDDENPGDALRAPGAGEHPSTAPHTRDSVTRTGNRGLRASP